MPARRHEQAARRLQARGALKKRFSPTASFGDTATATPTPPPKDPLDPLFPPFDNPLTHLTFPSFPPLFPPLNTASSTNSTTASTPSATDSTPSVTASQTSSSTPLATLPTNSATNNATIPLAAPASINTHANNTTTTDPKPAGSSNAGTIVGVVGACIVGGALLIALIAFFLRRLRQRKDQVLFDAAAFRRSGIMLDDPVSPSSGMANRPYFDPVTPQMTGRSSPYGNNMYGATQSGYGYANPQMGEYNMYNQPMQSPYSANPVNPFLNPAPYQESPFSPVASPIIPNANPNQLTRTGSAGSHGSAQGGRYSPPLPSPPAGDYLDLSRSSVTPFQAQQYAEISKTLNTEAPNGLPPVIDESEEDVPPVPEKEVFEEGNRNRQSTASENSLMGSKELEFPAPPPPTLVSATRYRVDSPPPMLPEIRIQQRDSSASFNLNSYDFPASVAGTPTTSGYPSGTPGAQTLVINEKRSDTTFPVTPSPLASSFIIPGQDSAPATPVVKETFTPAKETKPTRPETLYDADDAYGGI